jgi:hypothetical protein
MASFRALKIQDIEEDDTLSVDEKIDQLREIETEARGLQRAASESPMNEEDGWDDDLRAVRFALDKLGADQQNKGAATL